MVDWTRQHTSRIKIGGGVDRRPPSVGRRDRWSARRRRPISFHPLWMRVGAEVEDAEFSLQNILRKPGSHVCGVATVHRGTRNNSVSLTHCAAPDPPASASPHKSSTPFKYLPPPFVILYRPIHVTPGPLAPRRRIVLQYTLRSVTLWCVRVYRHHVRTLMCTFPAPASSSHLFTPPA